MSVSLRIAKGLRASYKDFVVKSVEETLTALKTRTDNYEVLNDDLNRIYGDIDGKILETATEEEFKAIVSQTQKVLTDFLGAKGDKYALMEANSYLLRKVSFRFVMRDYKTTKPENKEFAKQISKQLEFPEGVKIDTGVYGLNQKIRMLGSNKDGENRPLKLVVGDPVDTLISYCPEGCEVMAIKKEEKEKTKKKKKTDDPMLLRLLDETDNKRIDEYETWIQMGMICFNADADVSVWETVSARSSKYVPGDCDKKWKTFHKTTIGISTLWYWLKEDRPNKWEELKGDDYDYKKIEFEKTHFKLISPSAYGFIDCDGDFSLKTHADLLQDERNNNVGDVPFMVLWEKDPKIRTYDKLVFKPKQEVPANYYNLYSDWGEGVEGDVSVIQEVLMVLCNHDREVFDYVERWVAHIIQRPYQKTMTAIIFQSDTEGAGKDTYGDFICGMLGQYALNVTDAINEVFGRFTGHLKNKVLLKFEEMPFIADKQVRQRFKSLVTQKTQTFEDKGTKSLSLDNFVNVMGTTNLKTPAALDDKERRMVLIKCSEENVGKHEYWTKTHSILKKKETRDAYLYYLTHLDLTGFDTTKRPITTFYDETKLATRPYHARFFQDAIELNPDAETLVWYNRDLLTKIAEKNSKFEISDISLGRSIQTDYAGAYEKTHTKRGNQYSFNIERLKQVLINKNWWSDF